MTFDPFANNNQAATEQAPATPVNTSMPAAVAAAPNPFKIGFTLKAADQMSGEWLTPAVYGQTAQETAERGRDLIHAMQEVGLIDLTAKAASYVRSQHIAPEKPKGKPSFQGGKVQHQAQGGDYECEHGKRNFKDGGSWAAQFCGAPQGVPKDQQCAPLWRQKDGSFKAK
ncbi:hypothetical protein [Streptomyces yunnanensis]|uniref:Uncharacterized protein n=1 Tax=Streptomyces yunnanensis TaxID=156453 RepID=A0A9X8QZM1_9ACTN|nr:hypothetical protein [Streptomyces yunnanensis]SHN24240.1 hypothetical protein SAMN05216268_12680 [Streptomyces yunnanensis]